VNLHVHVHCILYYAMIVIGLGVAMSNVHAADTFVN
jgi:hypothetical protein